MSIYILVNPWYFAHIHSRKLFLGMRYVEFAFLRYIGHMILQEFCWITFFNRKKCKERSCVHIRKVYGLRGIKPWYTSRLIGTGCRCFKLEDWPFIILLTTYLEVQTYSTFFYRLQNVLPSHNFCQLSLYILLYRWWSQFYAMGCLGLKAKSMDWKYIQGEREEESFRLQKLPL